MTHFSFAAAIGAIALAAVPAAAQSPDSAHERHAGKRLAAVVQHRSVASLSQEEIAGLLEGSGMGMAQVAELNGFPGPRHVLDLADALELTPAQRRSTEEVFRRMNERAVALGMEIVEGERSLENGFAKGEVDRATLERRVSTIAELRGQLRAAHLLAHLEMKTILTAAQIETYDRLRRSSVP